MVLAKQLDKTVGDFHLVTRFHHKVQEEKNILEKKLIESEKNAKIQQQYVEELKVWSTFVGSAEKTSVFCSGKQDYSYKECLVYVSFIQNRICEVHNNTVFSVKTLRLRSQHVVVCSKAVKVSHRKSL